MSGDEPFKVVIAGASVAGLSLANMLQVNDIDFVVLEAYPTIAPQVGASIGLLPHGNRILDQLGLYEKVLQIAPPVDTFTFRDPSGLPLASYPHMDRNLIDRHGYPMIFLDRQALLQILYDNIKDKSKIMTNKRVEQVKLGENSVTAVVSDESMFQGDILIGADGIHSTIRGEMRELANNMRPGWFDTLEEEDLPCDYNCIFGISRPCHGIVPGGLHCVFRNASSYLITGGPNGQVYWFRFEKLPGRLHGSGIPRYTQNDLEGVLKRSLDDPILPGLTFSTLIKNRITAVMTPLPEYVYKKWHFVRIFTLGDSAHKLHPIGGHGGNAAIETAAALTNSLVAALGKTSSPRLTTSSITSVFDQVQTLRRPRVIMAKDYSHKRQRTESLDNPLRRLLALHLLPRVKEQEVTLSYSAQIPASEKLSMIPLPYRKKLIPYKDELLTEPKARGIAQSMMIGLYLICSAIALYCMWLSPSAKTLAKQLSEAMSKGAIGGASVAPLTKARIGVPLIDDRLAFMAASFVPGLRSPKKELGRLQLYLMSQLPHPITILTIEGSRDRFAISLLACPTLWLAASEIFGFAVVMPLYCIVYTFITNDESSWWPLRRFVSVRSARAMLPATLFGYVLPFMLTAIPWQDQDPDRLASFAVAWRVLPVLVPLLTWVFGTGSHSKAITRPSTHGQLSPDVQYLRHVYILLVCFGAIAHWYTLLQTAMDPEGSQVLKWLCSSPWKETSAGLEEGLIGFFCADFWGYCLTSYVWCVSAVLDLQRVGLARVNTGRAAIAILVAYLAISPGAAMAVVWYFRENALAFST